jgi:septum formation protein
MKDIVLASGSSSRIEILEKAGIKFRVVASNYDEDMKLALAPRKLAEFLSAGKASEVATRVHNSLVIGADSFAVFEGKLLGKPHTKTKAIKMLRALSGNKHQFITGFTIMDSDSEVRRSDSVVSWVVFKKLSDLDIKNYVESEDVLNKAGAYALQGQGMKLIERIEGDQDNVKGLPLHDVLDMLREFGYGSTG